jgi:hypothetical protein
VFSVLGVIMYCDVIVPQTVLRIMMTCGNDVMFIVVLVCLIATIVVLLRSIYVHI